MGTVPLQPNETQGPPRRRSGIDTPLACEVRLDASGEIIGLRFPECEPDALLGSTRKDLETDSECFWQTVHRDDRSEAHQMLRTAYASGEPFHIVVRQADRRPSAPVWRQICLRPTRADPAVWSGWITAVYPLHAAPGAAKAFADLHWEEGIAFNLMRHEIRMPLNAIVGFSELLEHTSSKRDQQEFVKRINESSGALLRLMQSILDYVRLRGQTASGGMDRISLQPFLAETLEHFEACARTKGLHLAFSANAELPRRVIGDIELLRKLLCILLENALHYTTEGTVRLEAKALPPDDFHDRKIQLSVCDTGDGIAPEHVARLFEPFEGVEDVTHRRARGAAGLGLAIASEICRLHDGSIHYEPRHPKGSCFVATVRLDSWVEPSAPPASVGPDDQKEQS